MAGVTRFTVSVPTNLLEAVDRTLVKDEENRSALVRRLLEQALKDMQERLDVERYIRSYRECPETEEEVGGADHTFRAWARENPWE
jgi:metal-responsive CopG/Arc/MetJ family transcriptional regulator